MAKVFTSTLQKEYTGSDENIQVHVEVQEESTKQVLHPASSGESIIFPDSLSKWNPQDVWIYRRTGRDLL